MGTLDKFERIAADAEYAVAIFANLGTDDVQFVDFWEPVPAAFARMTFIGCIGLVAGQPRRALNVEVDLESIGQLTEAFHAHLRKNIRWTTPGGTA